MAAQHFDHAQRQAGLAGMVGGDASMPGEVLRAEDDVMEMAGVDVLLDPAFTVPAVPEAAAGLGWIRCMVPRFTQFRSLAEAPDEVHVEFGLGLHAEAGALIAAVSTTANFTIALTWRRPAPQPPPCGSDGRP